MAEVTAAPIGHHDPGRGRWCAVVDGLLLTGLIGFMASYFELKYLFYDTVVTGGDTASWHAVAHHMKNVLLPAGRLTGWDMGNFCGYPNFSFYFIPPFLLAALPSYLFGLPLTVCLKLVIMSGVFLTPIAVYFGLRAMDYRFPFPIVGSCASLVFLFNESYTMFGGNTLSTFAGEFCYTIAMALFVLFAGTLYRGARTGCRLVGNGLLLGIIGLCHLFVFLPAVALVVFWYFAGARPRYLVGLSVLAFGIMAFWILPLVAFRHPYTTPVYMIWQDFVTLNHAAAGLGGMLLVLLPRLTLHAAAVSGEDGRGRGTRGLPAAGVVAGAGLLAGILVFLFGRWLCFGPSLWASGTAFPDTARSFLGAQTADQILPAVIPVALLAGLAVFAWGTGARRSSPAFHRFCRVAGASVLSLGTAGAGLGLWVLIARQIGDTELRRLIYGPWPALVFGGLALLAAGTWFAGRWPVWVLGIRQHRPPAVRFAMFGALVFSCGVGYFSAHFLKMPDIRFFPPLIMALLLVFFVETPAVVGAGWRPPTRVFVALVAAYASVLFVLFGADLSHGWFRYNNRGYAFQPGYRQFEAINRFLETSYSGVFADPLNAPRVGYEKCDAFDSFGGDRAFESLTYFSGRQTLEGIHFAGSMAAKFIAFLQTAYSREIKSPEARIFSRINVHDLPEYLDLYNISQLVLATNAAKEAVRRSPVFEEEAVFGSISVFRYTGSRQTYVEVPAVTPVVYGGPHWVEDFYRWYKQPGGRGLLLVPEAFVTDPEDRRVLTGRVHSLEDLEGYPAKGLPDPGSRISAHIEHLRVAFTTNRVGVPHLVKISYYPNWRVQGANGVYPVSPHLMLVIPREATVVLTYGANPWEKIGMGITLSTWAGLLVAACFSLVGRGRSNRAPAGLPSSPKTSVAVFRWGERWALGPLDKALIWLRLPLLAASIAIAGGLVAGGAVLRNRPVRAYVSGNQAYTTAMKQLQQGEVEKAREGFRRAVAAMAPIVSRRADFDHQDVIHCMLYTAMSLENLDEMEKAAALYRAVLADYPYSRYAAESHVKLGRLERRGRDPLLSRAMAASGGGEPDARLEDIRQALSHGQQSLAQFRMAIAADPYSVWAQYARKDLAEEEAFWCAKRSGLREALGEAWVGAGLKASDLLTEDKCP